MSISDAADRVLLDLGTELIMWSETVGMPGEFPKLWRRHERLFQRVYAPSSRRRATPSQSRRLLELDTCIEAMHRMLLPEVLERIEASFGPGVDASLWADLQPEGRGQVARARKAHVRAAEGALEAALLRFQRRPTFRHLEAAISSIGDVVEARAPRPEGFTEEQLEEAQGRLAQAIREELPPIAHEMFAADARAVLIGRSDPHRFPRAEATGDLRYLREDGWAPIWEEPTSSHAKVEANAELFKPEVQARYQERRLRQEIEHTHAEAAVEYQRREHEIVEEPRKQEQERLAEEEPNAQRAANRKAKEEDERMRRQARELAPRMARDQAEREGIAVFKSIIEPQRAARIRAAEDEFIRRWEGQKGARKDMN